MEDVAVEIEEAIVVEGRAAAAHLVVLIVVFVGGCCVLVYSTFWFNYSSFCYDQAHYPWFLVSQILH